MTDRRPIVHVVDDDAVARRHTLALLARHRLPTRSWPNASDFAHHAGRVGPGCVVIDLYRPGLDGPAIQRRLTEAGGELPAVVLTESGCMDAAVAAMRAGAIDCLRKPADERRMIDAVHAGFDRLLAARTRAETVARIGTLIDRLSRRERQVLGGLARGLSNKEIARSLVISDRTVEIYRASMMEKTGSETLSQALRIAFFAEELALL